MGVGAKTLSNVGKLKLNLEALKQIEWKVVVELFTAKTIIANATTLTTHTLEIAVRMAQEMKGHSVLPGEGKNYYPVELQVVKKHVNTTAYFVESAFQ